MVSRYIIFLENFLLYSFGIIRIGEYGFNCYNYKAELEFQSTERFPHEINHRDFLRRYNLYHE